MKATLFEQFLDEANFIKAYQHVRGKKARGGVDQVTVDEFGRNLKRNIGRLRKEIEERKYLPQPVQAVTIPKFNERKEMRQLGLPTVADKVVQRALMQVVEPLAEKMFHDTSYAYRPGKGHRKAIRRVEHNLSERKLLWVIHRDIDNFFDTLNHDRLLDLFADLVGHDLGLVELVALWCRSGIVAKNGKWKDVAEGVRQGQVISPLLANLYLHELDDYVEKQGWGWVRYADDYLLQCRQKEEVQSADGLIQEFLESRLSLRLNRDESVITSLEQGFDFLGIHFYGDERRISPKKTGKMKSKLEWLLSSKNRSSMEKLFRELQVTIDGWHQYYGFLGAGQQFNEIEEVLENNLTKLISQRIEEGHWPKEKPPELAITRLSSIGLNGGENGKYLNSLWQRCVPVPAKSVKHEADKKTGRRRREHQRKNVQEGEVFVLTPGHFIGKRGERIVVRCKQNIISEIPASRLKGLTLTDHALSLSTDVINFCARKDIALHLIDGTGKIVAVVQRPDSIRADLVLKQVTLKDDSRGLQLARLFVLGKVKNQLAILKSYGKYEGHRNNGFGEVFEENREELEELVTKIKGVKMNRAPDDFRNSLMGLEGSFASKYWRLMAVILPQEMEFEGRKRKGATDLVNSLLNYGYGILYGHALNAVTRVGLNAMAGFLHSYQSGKPVLTFDLVEEFRAPVVDRTVFSLINRGAQLGQEDNGLLKRETCKKLAKAIMARMGTETVHCGRRMTIQEAVHYQASSVKMYLCDKGKYKPFLSKW